MAYQHIEHSTCDVYLMWQVHPATKQLTSSRSMLQHYHMNIETIKVAAVSTVSCTVVTIRTAKCNTNTCTDDIFNTSIAVEVCSLWLSFRPHWNRVAITRLGCIKLEFQFRSWIQTRRLSSMNVVCVCVCVCVFIALLFWNQRKEVGLAVTWTSQVTLSRLWDCSSNVTCIF